MAFEDFTTYTESDPGSDISITSSKITMTNLQSRDSESYVYKDFGANYFDGDWENQCTWEITLIDPSARTDFMFANVVDDTLALESGDYIGGNNQRSSPGTNYYVILRELDGGTGYQDLGSDFSVSTPYYDTFKRYEGVGTYGTAYRDIYSDSDRTTLAWGLSVTLHSSKKDFRYRYPLNTYNSGIAAKNVSGYIENLDLAVGGGGSNLLLLGVG